MEKSNTGQNGKLGTFSGVFTPSVLTILGIILFLRLGYVVGNAGIARAFVIILIANLISILTSFSLAAIATNMKVKGGGDYYLISRTLGLEFGGAIGIVLFLAQSVSIAFYCIGFGEAVSGILATMGQLLSPQVIAFGALLFLFVLAFAGADLATKFQYGVMALLVLALASFYIGGIQKWDTEILMANFAAKGSGVPFWVLFALFFPAVTGFTQGVSMSGDLKDPGRSLPFGTFMAVGVSIIVYFTAALVFGASNSLENLASDYGAMKKTAAAGFLIDAGVICATLSSAMASFLGAPRILQSLAADKIFVFLNPFAKGEGSTNNPRRGVLLSLAIAVVVIALGQLDLIARVVSMFFLISYGLLNYATWFEAAAMSPSFRPRFKWYDKRISLAGFVGCLGVMMAIDVKTGVAACAVLFAIFQYLKRIQVPARWTDSQRSYHLQQIRKNLLAAENKLSHPRQWRPNILAMSNSGQIHERLLVFSEWIEGNSGMTTAVRMFQGTGYAAMKIQKQYREKLADLIKKGRHHAFPLVITGFDSENTISTLMQAHGIGPVTANTVLFDYDEVCRSSYTQVGLPQFKNHFNLIRRRGGNQVFVNMDASQMGAVAKEDKDKKQIDVWWLADDSSRLSLLLAYLCTRRKVWESAQIRLFAINYDRENADVQEALDTMLDDVRIPAVSKIVLGLDIDTILKTSGKSDIVFFPATIKEGHLRALDRFDPDRIMGGTRISALVTAAMSIDLQTDPEEGPVKELTQIHDDLAHALKRAKMTQKAANEAKQQARHQLEEIKQSMSGRKEGLEEKIQKMIAMTKTISTSRQKALKENAKLDAATKIARDKGIEIDD